MTKEPWARGGSPDRCVCPRLLYTQLPPALPLATCHPPPLVAPGGSYTNFQECLLPPSVPSKPSPPPLPPLYSTFAASTSLLPSPGTSRTSSRVSMATWGRVFAYYTLCVTSRLVMYARVGVSYLPPRALAGRMYACMCVGVRAQRGLQRNQPEV